MKNSLFVITVSGVIILSACSPQIPFTQGIREKYNLKDDQMRALQFYPSYSIILQRGEQSKQEQDAQKGKLEIKSGQYVEQVVIKAGTPGVVEKVLDNNRIAVSFELGENAYIIFGAPEPAKNERYTMLAAEWDGNKAKIEYGGKTYYTQPGSANAYLLFKMKKLNKYIREQRVAKGRKL